MAVFAALTSWLFVSIVVDLTKCSMTGVVPNHHRGRFVMVRKASATDSENLRNETHRKTTIVKLAVAEVEPNLIVKKLPDGRLHLQSGSDVEMLKVIAEKLNLQYEIAFPEDGEWGRRTEEGNWTGLIGMVHREEADIAAGTLSITSDRFEVVDFTVPYSMYSLAITTKMPGFKSKVYAVLMPFSGGVWIMIASAFLVNSALLSMIGLIYSDIFHRKAFTAQQAFWYLVGTFGSEGGRLNRFRGPSATVVISVWLMFMLVMHTCYSGTLTTVLSFEQRERAIETLEDLAEAIKYRGYKASCVRGTSHQASLLSLGGDVAPVADSIRSDDSILADDDVDGVRKLVTGDIAFIGSTNAVHYGAKFVDEALHVSDELLESESISFAVSRHFSLKAETNAIIQRVFEVGLMQKWTNDETNGHNSSYHLSERGVRAIALTLVELKGPFLLCAYGLSLATFVFVCEIIIHLLNGKNKTKAI